MKEIKYITEKAVNTKGDLLSIFLNSILLSVGRVGLLSVDRDHPRLIFYIKAAIQVAEFYGDEYELTRLRNELEKADVHLGRR
jgi:hypothetical protein